jgi:hypothetical protein
VSPPGHSPVGQSHSVRFRSAASRDLGAPGATIFPSAPQHLTVVLRRRLRHFDAEFLSESVRSRSALPNPSIFVATSGSVLVRGWRTGGGRSRCPSPSRFRTRRPNVDMSIFESTTERRRETSAHRTGRMRATQLTARRTRRAPRHSSRRTFFVCVFARRASLRRKEIVVVCSRVPPHRTNSARQKRESS